MTLLDRWFRRVGGINGDKTQPVQFFAPYLLVREKRVQFARR